MSAQAQNEQAEKQNEMYKRNAELREKVYQDQILRIAEQRKRVGEAANVEAEKYADAKLDQKKQLIEARGQIETLTGEGTGELGSLMLGVNRQGLTNLSRLESTFGTTTRNLQNTLTNLGFEAKDAQTQAQIGIESMAKAEGPSITSQLINIGAASAQGYATAKQAGYKPKQNRTLVQGVDDYYIDDSQLSGQQQISVLG
jgi:hypothetical protein